VSDYYGGCEILFCYEARAQEDQLCAKHRFRWQVAGVLLPIALGLFALNIFLAFLDWIV